MTDQTAPGTGRVRHLPPAPAGFDPFSATREDLIRHGLPRRPDPEAESELAALWERKADQYRDFEHLAPDVVLPAAAGPDATPSLGPDPVDSCGYTLTSVAGPFTTLFGTVTVPRLRYDADPFGINAVHLFLGLGFLDAHVQLGVDSSESVTSQVWAEAVGVIGLDVRPGDILSVTLCLETDAAGTGAYFFTNETTGQTMSFSVATGFPPAITVDAGVTRDDVIRPGQSVARFGTVYFDELSAYNSHGRQSVTAGQAITMTDSTGAVLARPFALNDSAFKVVHA